MPPGTRFHQLESAATQRKTEEERMEYRNLGSTGLPVSRLIFGGAHLGEIIFEDKLEAIIHACWDAGINTFYAADDYNNGDAERLLGRTLKTRRDDMVIITKTGYRVGTKEVPVSLGEYKATHGQGTIDHSRLWRKGVPPTSRGLNRKHLTKALEASLARLQTDYIDVYSTHFWDDTTPIEETLETLTGFVRQGKVRYLSCSQTQPWQLYRALWASDRLGARRYESVQIRYNILERTVGRQYSPAAKGAGVSLLAFNSLAGDLLTGEYRRDSARPTGRGYRQQYMDMYWNDATFDFLDQLGGLADAMGRPMGQLAQAWLLSQDAVTSLLIGPNEPQEVAPQAAALDRPLTGEELTAVSELLAKTPDDFSQMTVAH
jgi:aryl-alcohol dehydrogenase-like predicted oxidoreductase